MSSLLLTQLGKPAEFSHGGRFAALYGAKAAAEPAEDARLAEEDRNAARGAIELAFERLDADDAAQLSEKLRHTVLALCEAAVLPLAVEPEGLRQRVERLREFGFGDGVITKSTRTAPVR